MKKNLIALLAVVVLSATAVNAATAQNPIARWLNNTADSIERVNTDINKSQAKAEKESKMDLFEKSKQDSNTFLNKIFGKAFHLTGTTNYQKFYGHE